MYLTLLCDSLLQQEVHVQETAFAFQLEGMLTGIEIDDVVAVEKNQSPFLSRYRSNVFEVVIFLDFRDGGIGKTDHSP